ncbi:MAG: hypothetical protein PHQ27_10100 [Victivallales bacterium]|nr:hypothetical protein [Victivallales bacterium]
MSDHNLKYTEIAAAMIAAAKKHHYLEGPLAVIPELAEGEKSLFVMMTGRIGEYSSLRENPSLDQDEVHALFVFVLAKAAEAVSCWRCRQEFNLDSRGMFDGNVPLQSDPELMKSLRRLPLADDMYGAFIDWNADHPDFCAAHHLNPLLPLLEALKWTFRIAVGMFVAYFERRQS